MNEPPGPKLHGEECASTCDKFTQTGEVEEGPVDKESDDYKRNVLPVDHGWSWAVCFGGFLVSFILGMSGQTMALLFVEIIDLFDTNLTTGSLIFLFYILGGGIMSPLATSFFVPKVGEKRVICIAGFIFALTSIGYSFSDRIVTFLQCSAIKGLSFGAIFVPSISLLRHYLHQRRSLALNLARAGASVSGILMPWLIRLIRNELGVRGTFIVVGALELHIIVAGLLLRPLQAYKFKPNLPPLKPKWGKKGKSHRKDQIATDNLQGKEEQDTQNMTYMEMGSLKQNANQSGKLEEKPRNGDNELRIEEKSSLLEVLNTVLFHESGKSQSGNSGRARDTETNFRSRTFSMASTTLPEELVMALECFEEEESFTEGKEKQKFYQLWSFHMILVTGLVGAGNVYIRTYVPAIAVSQGATLDEAATLLTVIGVLDLTSRLLVGFFADTHVLRPSQIVAISHICLGLVCHVARLFTTFPLLVVMTTTIAIFLGTRISMMPLICIEVVGVDMMPQAFSIVTTVGTFSVAAMNPSLGAVADSFGSFVPVLHILGILFFLSAFILLVLPIAQRIDQRRGYTPT